MTAHVGELVVSGASYANDPTCAYGADGSVFFAPRRSASREVASSDFDRLGLHHCAMAGAPGA
jgi:hypothetical protein